MDHAEQGQLAGCCGTLFFADCEPGNPESFRLECVACGQLWRRNADGSLSPVDEPPVPPSGHASK
jgi:hypothetical protein